jgi:hypothetical protein
VSNSRRPAIGVDGLNSLKRSLKAAGVELQDLKDAHAAVAATVVRAARFTPKNPARSTGALAASVRGAGQAGAAVVRAGRASLPYTQPTHWGWPSRHVTAQPFVWDAIANTQEQWLGEYERALRQIINDIEGAPGP